MGRARAWLRGVGRQFFDRSLLVTLAADACFFLACLLCYGGQRLLRRRRPRSSVAVGQVPSGAGEPLLHSGSEARPRPLSATASNYLAFLDTGRRLFVILAVISVPTTVAVWGADLLARGEAVRSVQRTVFDTSVECRAGFPEVNSTNIADCTLGNSSQWLWHKPQVDDPRPGGFYAVGTTLEYCQHLALLCDAPAVAFGRAPRRRPVSHASRAAFARSECWLFSTKGAGVTSTWPGFVYCEGRQDFIPGVVEFVLTIVNGLITLVLACRLLWRLSSSKKSVLESFAVWFSELPCADREDGTPFELGEEDFQRVAQDLHRAVEAKLRRLLEEEGIGEPYLQEDKVFAVYVVPARRKPGGGAPAGERLAGHAFVLLRRDTYAAALVTPRAPLWGLHCLRWLPSYFTWHAHTLFKFGVPPWSAVTLRCQRAPPASDIIWRNLHVKSHDSLWRRRIGELLVLLFSLSLVAPVSLARVAYVVLDALREVNASTSPVPLPAKFWELLGHLVDNLPSYLLLLVNTVVMPSLIQVLSDMAKPHLRSISEASQFSINLFYLVTNSFLVPLLGFLTTDESRLQQALSYFSRLREEDTYGALRTIGMQSRQAPSELMLKYSANAALVTTACQLIQLGKGIARRALCLPDEPWPFAWGYWYAWSMSLLIVSLAMGVVMPTSLLLAALFFSLMRRVHKENLEQSVFDTKFEMDPYSEIEIVCWMVRAVAIFWTFMALFFYAQVPTAADAAITVWLPRAPVMGRRLGMVTLPSTSLLVPVRLLLLGALLGLAAGSCFLSRLFVDGGLLERQAWRRLGEGGPMLLVCVLRLLTLLLLAGSIPLVPPVEWERMEVPLQIAAAVALLFLAVLVYIASMAVQWLGQRKIRVKSVRDLRHRLHDSRLFDPSYLNSEDMTGIEETLLSRGGYRPFHREASGEMEAAQKM